MKEKLQDLNVIRGLAAIFVVIAHLSCFSGLTFPNYITRLFLEDTQPMPLFFMISSFVLSYNYAETLFDKDNFKNFYIKRFFRIVPLFWIILLFEFFLFNIFYTIPLAPLKDIFYTIFFFFPLIPGHELSAVWSGWTLGTEIMFYVMFPFAITFLNNNKKIIIAWIITLIASISINELREHSIGGHSDSYFCNSVQYFNYFIAGIFIFKNMKTLTQIKEKLKNKATLISSLSICTVGLLIAIYYKFFNAYIPSPIIYSIAYTLLICISVIGLPKILSNKLFSFTGDASYSIYLIHPIVLSVLQITGTLKYLTQNMSPTFTFIVSSFILLSITYIISYFSYLYIEKPFMKLGRNTITKGENKQVRAEQIDKELVISNN